MGVYGLLTTPLHFTRYTLSEFFVHFTRCLVAELNTGFWRCFFSADRETRIALAKAKNLGALMKCGSRDIFACPQPTFIIAFCLFDSLLNTLKETCCLDDGVVRIEGGIGLIHWAAVVDHKTDKDLTHCPAMPCPPLRLRRLAVQTRVLAGGSLSQGSCVQSARKRVQVCNTYTFVLSGWKRDWNLQNL